MVAAVNVQPEPFTFDPAQYAGLVWREVRRWQWAANEGALELDDLVQAGNEALAKAATKFDASRDVKFITYAGWWVREGVKREALDRCRTVRVPARAAHTAWLAGSPYPIHSQSLDTTLRDEESGRATYLSDLLGEAHENDGEREALNEQRQDAVAAAVGGLPPRLAAVVRARFFADLSLDEVGKQLGMSRERVRQLQVEALELLKGKLANVPTA